MKFLSYKLLFIFIGFLFLVLTMPTHAQVTSCTAEARGIETFSCDAFPPAKFVCGTAPDLRCVSTAPTLGANQEYNCSSSTCAPRCASNYRECSGTCTLISTIPTGSCTVTNTNDGTRDSCGVCRLNAPRTVTRQYSSPGSSEEGHINITGNINFGGDLWPSGNIYLNDARSIRIDADTQTSFSIGNYNSSAGVNDHFQLRIHSPSDARSELIFDQGGDRWSISTRTPSRNLEIFRNIDNTNDGVNNSIWDSAPLLSINYATGAVSIANNLTALGNTLLGTSMTDNWTSIRGTLIVNGEYMVMSRKDGVPTQNPSLGSIPAGALYYRTTAGDSGLKVYNGSTWGALGGGGLTTSGSVTAGKLPKFDGTTPNFTLTNSPIVVDDTGKVIIDNALTVNGCFGPVFVGITPDTFNGDINSDTPSGTLHGYRAAHDLCRNEGDEFEGSHMCSAAEIMNSINCGSASGTSRIFTETGKAWIANGAPALPTQINDCNGWTYNTGDALINGVAWEFGRFGGRGLAQTCDLEYRIACCK